MCLPKRFTIREKWKTTRGHYLIREMYVPNMKNFIGTFHLSESR